MPVSHAKKPLFLFLITWLHISLLDLFFVNYSGPVFLWAENSEFKTIAVHFSIACITALVFMAAIKVRQHYHGGSFSIREPILIATSGLMILSIVLLLLG